MSVARSATQDLSFAPVLAPAAHRYPPIVRLGLVLGLSTALWALIILGGWGLRSIV